jgi:hypothetical protein
MTATTMATVDTAQRPGLSEAHQRELLKGAGIGGLIGLFLGNPILGALGGAAFKLFTTEGMSEGMNQALQGFGKDFDLQGLNKTLFGADAPPKARPNGDRARANARNEKSGIPGWLKTAGIAVLGLGLFNTIFDNVMPLLRFGLPFMNPYYSGAGMFPFMR